MRNIKRTLEHSNIYIKNSKKYLCKNIEGADQQ